MFYFLDEPVIRLGTNCYTKNECSSNSIAITIIISVLIVIAVALLIVSILKKNKGGK